MKIADLSAYVLHYYANNAENYPTIHTPMDVVEELEVVEKIIKKYIKEYEDAESMDECYDEDYYRHLVMDRDFSMDEIYEALWDVYCFPNVPAIDMWIEDYKSKNK